LRIRFGRYQIDRSSRNRIILWLVVCLIFGLWALIPPWDNWAGAFGAMHGATGMVANLFIFGLPFSLGVALMFTTSSAHRKFAQNPRDSKTVLKTILIHYLHLVLVFSIYVTLVTIAVFSNRVIRYSHVNPIDIFRYFPGVVLSGIIISSILTSLLLPIVLAIDDWRFSTILGSGFLYGLSSTFGTSSFRMFELSLFSPFHLYRFLAIALSGDVVCPTMGQIWGDPDRMHMIMGLYVEWAGLLGPLLTYGIISVVSLLLSIQIYKNHYILWIYDLKYAEDLLPAETSALDTSEDYGLDKVEGKPSKTLTRHRQIVAVIIIAMIIGGPMLISSYERERESDLTHVLYENPGRTIVLGEWYYGEVEVPAPPVGMNNMYQIETEILDWGSCPEPLERWSGFRDMSLDEYKLLNVTEREDLISTRHRSITRDDPSTGSSWSGMGFTLNDYGTFVWFFKYNCTDMPVCSITVSIKVSVQSM
jgi:hypothetical protein